MLKYLLVLAVVVLVLWAVRRASLPPPPPKPKAPPPPAEPPTQLEAMVRCSHCGLHLPRGEALAGLDGELYCSPAHRDAGPWRA
ncbi:PP0621 family protein [Azohydromonas aeria]|uniref:PP0621 family protein n=1 Tax=Azohydromonas aeria TaxID=2590212 RepID=UPI0028738E95|nr:PP0621 family protein [Azohydromonas aeria]